MFSFRFSIHFVFFILIVCGGLCKLNVSIAQEANTILSGRVIYPNGEPVAGITITEHNSKSYSRTDSEGKFTLSNISFGSVQMLIPDDSVYIRYIKIGKVKYFYQSQSSRNAVLFSIVPGTIINDVEVIAEASMNIQGRIVFKDGKPLKNVFLNLDMDMIILYSLDSLVSKRSITTNSEGFFKHRVYAPSIVALTIQYRGLSAATDPFLIQKGKDPVTKVLELNGNPEDLTLPPVAGKNKPDRFMNDSDVPGMWVINPRNEHAYKLIKCTDRIEARIQAEKENAYLVTITSDSEQRWVETVFFGSDYYWIGITDKEKEGKWLWENGEKVRYTNWEEPRKDRIELITTMPAFMKYFGFKDRRDQHKNEIQDYGMMTFSADRNGKWKKVDSKNPISRGFQQMAIIEKEAN